jgi:hypothetical protein
MVVDVRCGGAFDSDGDGDGGGSGDPEGGPEVEAIVAMVRRKVQMDADLARAVAEFEVSGAWQASGAVSTRAWLVHHCHLSRTEARRQVRFGRALRSLPLVDAAFAEGAITADHVGVLLALDHGVTREPLHHQEQLLVDLARTYTFDQFKRLMAYWRQGNDPDGTDDEAEERRNRRDVHLNRSLDGMWLGRMVFDPVSGTTVAHELERLGDLLFESDWAEATERLGRMPLTCELGRTPSQRRADAMVMMAMRSASRTQDARKPTPLFHIHLNWATAYGALCELENGPPLPPREALSWLDGADVVRVDHTPEGPVTMSHAVRLPEITVRCLERAVLDGPDRKQCPPTDRVFSGATRRAIEIRDGQCVHPYCDRPARWCQIDHIKPYTQGGPTTQENGRLLCGFHNRWYYRRFQRYGESPQTSDEQTQQPPEERPPPRRE